MCVWCLVMDWYPIQSLSHHVNICLLSIVVDPEPHFENVNILQAQFAPLALFTPSNGPLTVISVIISSLSRPFVFSQFFHSRCLILNAWLRPVCICSGDYVDQTAGGQTLPQARISVKQDFYYRCRMVRAHVQIHRDFNDFKDLALQWLLLQVLELLVCCLDLADSLFDLLKVKKVVVFF